MCCMDLHPCSSTILASRILTYLEYLSIHLWGTRFSEAKGNQLKAGRGGGGVRKELTSALPCVPSGISYSSPSSVDIQAFPKISCLIPVAWPLVQPSAFPGEWVGPGTCCLPGSLSRGTHTPGCVEE